MSRRATLGALLLAPAATACAAEEVAPAGSRGRTLVAYFSRSGNTRVIAGQLERELPADLFEIRPAEPYPADYEQAVEQARRERDAGFEPRLAASVPDIGRYERVFLGFPIWGETAPPVIRSFLRTHDLGGKVINPFVTHGGFGLGNSLSVLRSHAPRAQVAEPFSLESDQERRTMTAVRGWLAQARAGAA